MGNLESTPKAQAFKMMLEIPRSFTLKRALGAIVLFEVKRTICLNTVKTILDDDTRHPLYWIEVQSELEQMTFSAYQKYHAMKTGSARKIHKISKQQ